MSECVSVCAKKNEGVLMPSRTGSVASAKKEMTHVKQPVVPGVEDREEEEPRDGTNEERDKVEPRPIPRHESKLQHNHTSKQAHNHKQEGQKDQKRERHRVSTTVASQQH